MPPRKARGTAVYTKPALTEPQLLSRWSDRGLVIPDKDRAIRYLRHIGYYRLSAYVRSFESGQRDVLTPGTTFDSVLSLYIFDRKLRLLVLDALERTEVAVRTAISDRMATTAGPHWYENGQHFADKSAQQRLLDDIDRLVAGQMERPREQATGQDAFVSALEHYVTQYGSPARPPSWLILEELSFGSLRKVYDSLANSKAQGDIADLLGLKIPLLSSWLRSYQRVRNICAHHGRLWNRGLGVYPAIPRSRDVQWLTDRDLFTRQKWRGQRLYPVLVSLQSVLHTIAPGSLWAARLHELFREHPAVPLAGMGIPANWYEDLFWPRTPQ